MKKGFLIAFAATFACVLLFAGCGKNQKYLNDDDIIKIGFVPETMTVERWQRDRDVFVAKARQLGAVDVIVNNAYEDAALQEEICKEMIAEGVDVLVIIPYDKNSLKKAIEYAHDNNVKVIAYDRIIRDANVDLYITFDNYKVGELIGTAVSNEVPEGKYIILNGAETDYNAFMLNEGCMSVLQPKIDSGKIEVVEETWIKDWRDELAYQFVSDAIADGITFDAIVAANDRVAEGAVRALSENRLAGKVYVTGQDAELGACQRIIQETQNMTVYKSIKILAEGAAEMAVLMAIGKDINVDETINDGTFEIKYIAFEPVAVTKDNIDETVIEDGFFTAEQIYKNTD